MSQQQQVHCRKEPCHRYIVIDIDNDVEIVATTSLLYEHGYESVMGVVMSMTTDVAMSMIMSMAMGMMHRGLNNRKSSIGLLINNLGQLSMQRSNLGY